MARKLMPKQPGERTMSAGSLARPRGGKPMNGAGTRGTGRPKLNPTAGMSTIGVPKRQTKNGPMNGVRGPTKTE